MKDYIEFHKSSIKNGKLKKGIPYIIYECNGEELCGGVGDRVLGMAKALYFAISTGRVLLIDSTYPVSLEQILKPNLIEWNAAFPNTPDKFDDLKNDMPLFNRKNTLGYRLGRTNGHDSYRLSEILDNGLFKDRLESKGLGSHIGSSTLSVARAFHDAFWALFKFDDVVLSRAEQMKLGSGLPRGSVENDVLPYVGLHHREGDYAMFDVEKNTMIKRFVGIDQPLKCYDLVKAKFFLDEGIVNPSAYIASDDASTKKEMKEKDPSIFYYDELQIFHIDWSVREGTNTKDLHTTSSIQQGVVDMLAEVAVLVDSKCLVMSQSMFSYLAYYIRGPDDRCNIHVKPCTWDTINRESNLYAYESGDKSSKEISAKLS